MQKYLIKDFGKILKKNHLEYRHILGPDTTCMRVYDRNLSEFPVTVDLYGDYLRINGYGEMAEEVKECCISECADNLYIKRENIFFYQREKVGLKQHEKSDEKPVITVCKENGLSFEVNLTTYADTGLFPDQNYARVFIKNQSEGKRVLNLFSYTGSFSVYAAYGGAECVKSIDLSKTYTAWAQRNLKQNGFFGNNFECICQDALSFIEQEQKEGNSYSIIIFDPPSFSNSRKLDYDFDIKKDFSLWMDKIRNILTKDGFVLFSTNLSSFRMNKINGFKINCVTDMLRVPGFKKDMPGAVRNWIMTKDYKMFNSETEKSRKKKFYEENMDYKREKKHTEHRQQGREYKGFREHSKSGAHREYGRVSETYKKEYGKEHKEYTRVSEKYNRERNDFREHKEYTGKSEKRNREYRDFREHSKNIENKKANNRRIKPYGYEFYSPKKNKGKKSEDL